MDRQRIDKWLWHARMLRTRSDASAFVEAGHVRVNGARISAPGHLVRPDDVITLALDRSVRIVAVLSFAERRGDAAAARVLYRELTGRKGPAGLAEP
jgi:ribosome-associated heat shock protein Hsp15